jgi:Protein of unknown function (DUF1203)
MPLPTAIRFIPLPTKTVRALQSGAPDAYGKPPESAISNGDGVPCRHCLKMVEARARYLIVAHRPFSTLQPYAETGPIFLHAEPCEAAAPHDALPAILASPDCIVRGYSKAERIVYGSGAVTSREAIASRAAELLARDDIAFVDVRSARNNCFLCRVVKA